MGLDYKKTYILLKFQFKKKLFEDINKYLTNDEVSNFLKIKVGTFKYWKSKGQNYDYKTNNKFTKSYVPLNYIYSLIKFLRNKDHKEYSVKSIEKNLIEFKSKGGKPIKNPKFPINLETKESAILVAALLCDGGISENGYPLYNNSESCMRKRVVGAINNLIGKIHTNPLRPNENDSIVFPKTIKDILVIAFDMKIGDKVTNNPRIPELFMKTNNKEIIGAFLNQAFSDDGTAYIIRKSNQGYIAYGASVNVTDLDKNLRFKIKNNNLFRYGNNLVNDCKLLLEKFEISVNGPYCKNEYIRNKYGKKEIIHSWGIQIQGRKNIKKFKNLVGFSIPRKNRIVTDILNNYKEVDYGSSFENALNIVKKLHERNELINTITFMKNRKCTCDYARYLLKLLRKEGIIKRCGGGIHKGGHLGYTPYEYKLVNK